MLRFYRNISPTKVAQKPGVSRAKLIAAPFQKVFIVMRRGVCVGCPHQGQYTPSHSVPQLRHTVFATVALIFLSFACIVKFARKVTKNPPLLKITGSYLRLLKIPNWRDMPSHRRIPCFQL